jgi:hypothetical protein
VEKATSEEKSESWKEIVMGKKRAAIVRRKNAGSLSITNYAI